jgi:branched-chain amino acid aminotransferase
MGSTAVRALNYVNGEWIEGNPAIVGPMSHTFWLASTVFDGARSFEGVAPDLDLHCERVVRSALAMGLEPTLTAVEVEALCRKAISRFPKEVALYIRPMFYAEEGFVAPDPSSTRFVLSVYESPMPGAAGFTACLSSRQRPSPSMALTSAKAASHYPNAAAALREARGRGFDNAVMLDPIGNLAEFATSNLFIAKGGVVRTPVPNGTFLNGITRQRVIKLLQEAEVPVEECTLTVADLTEADEVFSTGNYAKVVPVTRVEDRNLQPGPLCQRARDLYWAFAHS